MTRTQLFWSGASQPARPKLHHTTRPKWVGWLWSGCEAYYFQCKVVNNSKRKIWCCWAQEKSGAAQQKENWCCTAKRIWCCWAKRKVGAAEQREIWCSVHKRNLVLHSIWCKREEERLVRTKIGSCLWFRVEFRVCAAESKRDCALKPLVHIKIFSPLAPCEAESEKRENSPKQAAYKFICHSLFFTLRTHTHTFLRHTILPFDCIDYFVQIAHLHTFTFYLLFVV